MYLLAELRLSLQSQEESKLLSLKEEELQEFFRKQFLGHFFAKDQLLIFQFKGSLIRCQVTHLSFHQLGGEETPESFGMVTAETGVDFSSSQPNLTL